MTVGRRVVVYGPSGSGKTTLGQELARRLDLPYIELDAVFHYRPAWEDRDIADFRGVVSGLLQQHANGWIFDGNYSSVRDLVLPRADTVIWLRLPFRTVYPRLVRRTLRRAITRETLWGTNRERWRDLVSRESMLVWGIKHWRAGLRSTEAAIRNAPPATNVIILRSTKDVAAFVAELNVLALNYGKRDSS